MNVRGVQLSDAARRGAKAKSAKPAMLAPIWRYRRRMPSVQVKNVPDALHAELRRRAARKGISLQDYVLQVLKRDTAYPPIDEVFERIERGEGGRSGGHVPLDDVVAIIRAHRDADG